MSGRTFSVATASVRARTSCLRTLLETCLSGSPRIFYHDGVASSDRLSFRSFVFTTGLMRLTQRSSKQTLRKMTALWAVLCVVAASPTLFAESQLPTYTEGQEIERPLVADKINTAQFAALRLSRGALCSATLRGEKMSSPRSQSTGH